MRLQVLMITLATAFGLGMTLPNAPLESDTPELIHLNTIGYDYPHHPINMNTLQAMLKKSAPTLSELATQKVLTALECANSYQILQNPILAVIDYSLPSSQKRLWIFNLKSHRLLFNTYVSHGIKSGSLLTTYFSNRNNSRSSSIGIYLTNNSYRGREGLSLRLTGLDRGFNDNAENRAIVMHGGWYMNEDFIQKYGRPGRSWGCPAVPLELSESIINTIKNQALFVVYYPNESWFQSSKFLNCSKPNTTSAEVPHPSIETQEQRDDVLFANLKIKHAETDPILTMPALRYQEMFHTPAPLTRMLRRQIQQTEYVALSDHELHLLVTELKNKNSYQDIAFVIPSVKMERGYYITEMKILQLGKIKDIQAKSTTNDNQHSGYTVYFENKTPITLRQNNQFIRWLGL